MAPSGTTSPTPADVLDRDAVHNILLLVPPLHRADLDGCIDLLTPTDVEQMNVWSLGITLSPDKRVANWHRAVGEKPGAFKVVSVGEHPQEQAEALAASYGFEPEPHFVVVPYGGDLTQIGIELIDALDEWEANDRQTVVCVHSLTALLQYIESETAFRFLKSFTDRIEQAGAIAHYHMNPGAHDDAVVSNVATLFDAMVALNGEGTWELTRR